MHEPSNTTTKAKSARSGSNAGAGGSRTRTTTTTTTSSHSRSSSAAADHQSTPVTFEYAAEKVRYLKWTAFGLSIVLILLALALTITGTAATLYTCQESRFASYTPLIAIVLLAPAYLVLCRACLTLFCAIFSNKRLIATMSCLSSSMISVFILIVEVLSLRCTWAGSMPPLCRSFRKNANICHQLIDILYDDDENEIPHDNFRNGRVALVLLSFVAVFASVVTLTTLLTSFHTTGEPVYLYRKRKATSYIVGDPGNVPLSFHNLDRNVKLVSPTDEELKIYNDKREKFGEIFAKFSTSGVGSNTNDSARDDADVGKIARN